MLFAWFCALCTITTILLSIDTTAVLLTPVGIALARRLHIEPLPFAFAALWFAHTASLLLPISNLTNLLAVQHAEMSLSILVTKAALPQAVLLAATVVALVLLFRRQLTGRHQEPDDVDVEDPWLLVACALATVVIGVAIAIGWPAWAGALAGLGILVVAFVLRRPQRISMRSVAAAIPVGALILALALFVLMHWLSIVLTGPGGPLTGHTLSPTELVATGALLGNVANNLPAYLFLEPFAQGPDGIVGLLVGVNAGALLTPWGSLATILWLQICRRRLVAVSARRLFASGLVLVPLALVPTAAVLTLV